MDIYCICIYVFIYVYDSALMLLRLYWLLYVTWNKTLNINDVIALIYVTLLRKETNLIEKASLSVTLSSLLLYREGKPTRLVESS